MEKVYIVDGCDNTGKSTLINNLTKHFEDLGKTVFYIHCGTPKGETNKDKWIYQQRAFWYFIGEVIRRKEDIVIFDRFVEGEYVYGPRYREEDPEEVLEFIKKIQTALLKVTEVHYISLTADLEFLLKNDDGNSLSKNDPEKVSKEISDFKKVYEETVYPHKKLIKVNCYNNFKTEQNILEETLTC